MQRLAVAITAKQNPTVLGLDPRLDMLPPDLIDEFDANSSHSNACKAIYQFNVDVLAALSDIVPAVKFQLACYEAFGEPGMVVFEASVKAAKKLGYYVMADGKRNDIGSSAEQYAEAFLSDTAYNVDCLTVNAYLGSDGIVPFHDTCMANDRDIFALVKTSNPSSGELQDLVLQDGRTVYRAVADTLAKLGADSIDESGYSRIGFVVGATYPEQLAELRRDYPNSFFLVPGYGAQGGSAETVMPGFDVNGGGAIINNSRGIMTAWKEHSGDYAEAARTEAIEMRDALRAVLPVKHQCSGCGKGCG